MDEVNSPYTPLLRVVQEPFMPKPLSGLINCLTPLQSFTVTSQSIICYLLCEILCNKVKSSVIIEMWFLLSSVTVKSVLTAIHIVNITIGAIYISDCPGQPLIPYYLIIWGAGSLLFLFLTCLPCGDGREPIMTGLWTLCAQGVLLLLLFSFFIAGNVWIFSLYSEQWDSQSSLKRCNRVLYLYAFWITMMCYLCIAVLLLGILCVFFCFCILRATLPLGPRTDRYPN